MCTLALISYIVCHENLGSWVTGLCLVNYNLQPYLTAFNVTLQVSHRVKKPHTQTHLEWICHLIFSDYGAMSDCPKSRQALIAWCNGTVPHWRGEWKPVRKGEGSQQRGKGGSGIPRFIALTSASFSTRCSWPVCQPPPWFLWRPTGGSRVKKDLVTRVRKHRPYYGIKRKVNDIR